MKSATIPLFVWEVKPDLFSYKGLLEEAIKICKEKGLDLVVTGFSEGQTNFSNLRAVFSRCALSNPEYKERVEFMDKLITSGVVCRFTAVTNEVVASMTKPTLVVTANTSVDDVRKLAEGVSIDLTPYKFITENSTEKGGVVLTKDNASEVFKSIVRKIDTKLATLNTTALSTNAVDTSTKSANVESSAAAQQVANSKSLLSQVSFGLFGNLR